MRIIFYTLSILVLSCQLGTSQSAQNLDSGPDGFVVQLHENASLEEWKQARLLRSNTSFILEKILSPTQKILWLKHVSGRTSLDDLKLLEQSSQVKYVQLNEPVVLRNTTPNDPFWDAQWNLQRIGALSMWVSSNEGKMEDGTPIVLGVLEIDGYDIEHEDLRNQVWINEEEIPLDGIDNDENGYIDDYFGWNAMKQNDDHAFETNHGTEVAGIMSASTNNEKGIPAVGWNSKILFLSGSKKVSDVIENYEYVLQARQRFNATNGKEGAFVVATNASLGLNDADPRNYPIWCEMYDRLGEAGILSIAAAANRPINTDLRSDMPISCSSDFLITVTGVDGFDRFSRGKAFGPETVDIAAPAGGYYTTYPGNNYVELLQEANSYAAPHLTGAVGLMYSLPYPIIGVKATREPAELALMMRSLLLEGAEKLPSLAGLIATEGRLDLQQTHQLLHQKFKDFPIDQIDLEISKIYPNPFQSGLMVDLQIPSSGDYAFKVLDLQGRQLFQQKENVNFSGYQSFNLELDHLPAGMYVLYVEGAGTVVTNKLVKLSN